MIKLKKILNIIHTIILESFQKSLYRCLIFIVVIMVQIQFYVLFLTEHFI